MSERRGLESTRSGRRGRARAPSLGPALLEAVSHFVRILARCGAKGEDIVAAVRAAADRIPPAWAVQAEHAIREIDYAGHVLTIWFSEPGFLDGAGKPVSLPFEGGLRSVAALVRSADRRLNAREVLAYLLKSGAVRRQGQRYLPRARSVQLRGWQGPASFHAQRMLSHMLATLEHNVMLKRAARGWFQYAAENRRFPLRARAELDERVRRLGMELLSRLDAYMRRREVTAKPGEPTLRVGVGLHLWEGHRQSLRPRRTRRRPARSAKPPGGSR